MLKDTERVMHDRGKKVHKPKMHDGVDGRREKKRVRAPHNTREKQRQRAIGHGETLMPNNVIYRTPNAIIHQQEPIYTGTAIGAGGESIIYDSRTGTQIQRPNSIELRRSYQTEQIDGYGMGGPASPGYHQQQNNYQQQMGYDDGMYNNNQHMYGSNSNNQISQENLYAPGTPSRGNSKSRPSQPPPAPPSNGSGNGTPNVSNANTPTRGRSISSGRDTLPPPPPIPEQLQSPPTMNGGNTVAAKLLLNRSHSSSRAGSPQLGYPNAMQGGMGQDPNQIALAQLNQQINKLNDMNSQLNQISINDLPPPPPIPEQVGIENFVPVGPKPKKELKFNIFLPFFGDLKDLKKEKSSC